MGVFNPLNTLSFFFFLFLLVRPLFADIDSRKTPPPPPPPRQDIISITASNSSSPPPPSQDNRGITASNSSPPPSSPTQDNRGITASNSSPPPTPTQDERDISPFRPSIAVVVAVLTTMFSITFLILLYAKHCKRSANRNNYTTNPAPSTARKNSGIDRTVIESLPIFRFGSLRGQKDGLECAVCLNKFETTEVLKLLPKCKHAFHVECVDTWLDAHSTCPLCRFRIDPEDILLIGDPKILHENQLIPPTSPRTENVVSSDMVSGICGTELVKTQRVLGRHSSAGERGSNGGESNPNQTFRKSLDSHVTKSVSVGCFDRPRKDGLLLTNNSCSSSSEGGAAAVVVVADRTSLDRRFEHRIVISNSGGVHRQRWSDVQPSDLLYLRSEMIISDSRRFSSSTVRRQQHHDDDGRSVINGRSVSEITGLSRSSNNNNNNSNSNSNSNSNINGHYCYYNNNSINNRERQAGVISRWLAWISTRSETDVRSERTTSANLV